MSLPILLKNRRKTCTTMIRFLSSIYGDSWRNGKKGMSKPAFVSATLPRRAHFSFPSWWLCWVRVVPKFSAKHFSSSPSNSLLNILLLSSLRQVFYRKLCITLGALMILAHFVINDRILQNCYCSYFPVTLKLRYHGKYLISKITIYFSIVIISNFVFVPYSKSALWYRLIISIDSSILYFMCSIHRKDIISTSSFLFNKVNLIFFSTKLLINSFVIDVVKIWKKKKIMPLHGRFLKKKKKKKFHFPGKLFLSQWFEKRHFFFFF